MRKITYAQAINEAQDIALGLDPNVICYGLGVPDPKGVFGTTLGLQEKYGADRVFDMPTAENGMLGVGIGAAITGLRPVMVSQRLDFFLLAMDQLVNNAAKWHYMFGSQSSVPITIRLILGRGWGQGPTHSQNLQAWFAHIPGLKVVMPTTPADVKGLLLSSIFDPNPVVFLEHRWLYNQMGNVPEGDIRTPLGESVLIRKGDDVTVVAMSYMTIEALRAVDALNEQGISCDVIDLRTISPLNMDQIIKSLKKTGRLLCLDTGSATCSVSSEVIARATGTGWSLLKTGPRRLALPDIPTPTSAALTKSFYPQVHDIICEVGALVGKDIDATSRVLEESTPCDVPGEWFKGPF